MTHSDSLREFHSAILRIHPWDRRWDQVETDHAAEARLVAAVREGGFGPRVGDALLPDAPYQCKINAIYHLIDSPYVDLVRAFLDAGSDVNQRSLDEDRQSPLLVAAATGNWFRPRRSATSVLSMVRLLLERDADVHASDRSGWTALHKAIPAGACEVASAEVDLVRCLLEHGADPLAQTSAGETPVWVVAAKSTRSPNRDAILRLLRAAARGQLEKRKPKTLAFKKRKEGFDLTRDRGIDALATYVRNPELGWAFLAVRAPIEDTARALVEAAPGARWEKDCAKRYVEDGLFSCFVTRFVPAEWTLVLYGSAMLVKRALFQQLQAHAEAIAKALGVEVVAAIGKRTVAEYAADGTQVMHEYGEDEVFYAGAKQEMLELFKERRIFVPPFSITGNGLTIELVLHGVTKEHVERLDAVIFGEI